MAKLATLEPKPGQNFGGQTHYVTDVYITKVGEIRCPLERRRTPKAADQQFLWAMIQKNKEKGYERDVGLRSGQGSVGGLVDPVDSPAASTIRKVTEIIVRYQRDFRGQRVQNLKPLILKMLPMTLECESTVSRVTTQKYVQTPRDFRIEVLLTAGSRGFRSEDLASEAVKSKIKKLVDGEPLTNRRARSSCY